MANASVIVANALTECNSLCIVATGLDTHSIIIESCKRERFPDAIGEPIRLIIGLSVEEARHLSSRFLSYKLRTGDSSPCHLITADLSINDRMALYRDGGIFIVTSRIVTNDLLSKTLPPGLISYVLCPNAHRANFNFNESFIMQVVRRENSMTRLSALSDQPAEFQRSLAATMQSLHVRTLRLFPRFHRQFSDKLSSAEFEEFALPLDPNSIFFLNSIDQLIAAGLNEIQRAGGGSSIPGGVSRKVNSTIDIDLDGAINDENGEEGLVGDGTANAAGGRATRLKNELKKFEEIRAALVRSDPTKILMRMLMMRRIGEFSEWFASKAGVSVLRAAKRMVYDIKVLNSDNQTTVNSSNSASASSENCKLIRHNVIPVKWTFLVGALAGWVDKELVNLPQNNEGHERRILILTPDEATATIVRQIVAFGPKALAEHSWSLFVRRMTEPTTNQESNGRVVIAPVSAALSPQETLLLKDQGSRRLFFLNQEDTRVFGQGALGNRILMERDAMVRSENHPETSTTHGVIIPLIEVMSVRSGVLHAVSTTTVSAVSSRLESWSPHLVVCFDPMLPVVRSLEHYSANCKLKPQMWVLATEGGPDTIGFADAVVRETRAWENLSIASRSLIIRTDELAVADDATMQRVLMLHNHASGAMSNDPLAFQRQVWSRVTEKTDAGGDFLMQARSSSSRQGHNSRIMVRASVIVDVREFNAALPARLFRCGVRLIPAQLAVGDYVLSREAVIERKSVPDLAQSLPSGRLLEQSLRMAKFYKSVFLLIELAPSAYSCLSCTPSNSRLLSPRGVDGSFLDSKSTLALLVLYTIHCPWVIVIWSISASHSAQMLVSLKTGRQEPSLVKSLAAGTSKWNQQIADGVEEAPGSKKIRIDEEENERINLEKDLESEAQNKIIARDAAKKFLRSIPGVSERIIKIIERECSTLADLFTWEKDKMIRTLGKNGADGLYSFIHESASWG